MTVPNYIATGGGRYRVMVDGVEVSPHTQYHTALARASQEKACNPDSDVEVLSDFRVRVELAASDCPSEPTTDPEPEPTPDPEPDPVEPDPVEPGDTYLGNLAEVMLPGETRPLDAGLPAGFDNWLDFIRHAFNSDCPDQWGENGHWHRGAGQTFFMGDRTKSTMQRDPDEDNIVFVSYLANENRWVHNSKTGVRDSNDHHPYSQMALDEKRDRYYRIRDDAIWVYDMTADTQEGYEGPQAWTRIDQSFPTHPNAPKEVHEALDRIIMADEGGNIYGVNPDDFADQALLGTRPGQAAYQSLMTYNRTRKELMWVGGNNSDNMQMVTLVDAQGNVIVKNDAPADVVTSISTSRIFSDPVTGNYLLFDNKGSDRAGVFWEYSPDLDEWRVALDLFGDDWWPGPYCGHVMIPLNGYGVIMWLTRYGVRLYKHKSVFSEDQPIPEPTPEPAPEPQPSGEHPFYAIAQTLQPGEFRHVETTFPPGVDSIAEMNHTDWHPDADPDGTFGVGWTGRHVFDPDTGRLFNVLMRGSDTHSITWLEPDLGWTGILAPPEAGLGGRRPYDRLFGLDGYLYWFPQNPNSEIGRITRARYETPDQWEDVGAPPLPFDVSHAVGDYSTSYLPEIGKFVLYIYGRGRYDVYGSLEDEGIHDYVQGRTYIWGPGDEAWVPPETEANYLSIPVPENSYPAQPGQTQSSGYGGTTLYNPLRKEVLIYGGSANWSNPHPLGPECTATIDEHGIFRRHGPSGLVYSVGSRRLTYNPVTGDYIVLDRTDTEIRMWEGDPPRGKPWQTVHVWPRNSAPFDRYDVWHRVCPLPGTDVLIWSDLRRGIILHRVKS